MKTANENLHDCLYELGLDINLFATIITPSTLTAIYNAMERHASQDKWISVEDELPEESGYYLVYYENEMDSGLDIRYYRSVTEGGHWQGFQYSDNKFWQPLPKPPKQ